MQDMNGHDGTGQPAVGHVVCFGVLSYLQLMAVDQVPVHNGGTQIRRLTDSYGDDAAIVAGMLHDWGQRTTFIPSALGDDDLGPQGGSHPLRLGPAGPPEGGPRRGHRGRAVHR